MNTKLTTIFLVVLSLCFSLTYQVHAQDFDKVKIETVEAGENVYMLKGSGGNIGLFVSDDGIFLIDDQFAPLHDKIKTAISALSDKPITFLLNTHFHPDHTGGNELIGQSGSVIIAHENVRKRLSVKMLIPYFKAELPPLPTAGRPVVTFTTDLSFHMGDERIDVIHVAPSHTDGDAIVVFNKANVIHTGDIYFSGAYPFVDLDNGGSVSGLIKAAETILSLADDNTRLIPGHGDITGKKEFEAYYQMIIEITKQVTSLAAEGKTLDEIIAANPTASYDSSFKGMIPPESFVEFIWREISTK